MQRTRSTARRQTLGAVPPAHGNSSGRRRSVDPSSISGGSGHNALPAPTNGAANINGHSSGKPTQARPPRGRVSMIPRVGRENVVPPTPPPNTGSGVAGRTSSTKVAPSNPAMSSGRRRSTFGGSQVNGDRRHSTVLQQGNADPRPISDKAYQQDCIIKLLSYLQKSGYDHPVSHKTLARPSGKDFTNIVTFMLRQVDPSFQDGTLKIEDEVAMNFKAMGYPFAVSKTALVAAGSPHTWPSLLAALTWLMTRIESLEAVFHDDDDVLVGGPGGAGTAPVHFESLEELETKTDKFFFKYLSAAYAAFLKGDEILQEKLKHGLHDRLERDDKVIEVEISQMEQRNASMTERLTSLGRGEGELKTLVEKRDGYATDLEQFHDLIEQMDQHVATLVDKKKDRSQQLEDTNKKLADFSARVDHLKTRIGNQDLSVEDVQKLQNEQKGVEEAIDRANVLKDKLRGALWEVETEVEKFWGELESMVVDYNASIGDLTLLSLLATRNLEMKAVLEKEAAMESDQSKLLAVNLVDVIKPALESWKEEYANMLSESKWEYQESLDKLGQSEEAFTEAMERRRIVDKKTDKCDDTMAAERDAQEAKLGVRIREADSIEQKVASLRDPVALEEQMAQYERKCTEIHAKRQLQEEQQRLQNQAVCEEIHRACLAMKQYDDFCLEKIAEVQRFRTGQRSSIGKLMLSLSPKT